MASLRDLTSLKRPISLFIFITCRKNMATFTEALQARTGQVAEADTSKLIPRDDFIYIPEGVDRAYIASDNMPTSLVTHWVLPPLLSSSWLNFSSSASSRSHYVELLSPEEVFKKEILFEMKMILEKQRRIDESCKQS